MVFIFGILMMEFNALAIVSQMFIPTITLTSSICITLILVQLISVEIRSKGVRLHSEMLMDGHIVYMPFAQAAVART